MRAETGGKCVVQAVIVIQRIVEVLATGPSHHHVVIVVEVQTVPLVHENLVLLVDQAGLFCLLLHNLCTVCKEAHKYIEILQHFLYNSLRLQEDVLLQHRRYFDDVLYP